MSNYGNLNINRNKNRKGKKIIIALICIAVLILAFIFYIGITVGSNNDKSNQIADAIQENTELKLKVNELNDQIAQMQEEIDSLHAELEAMPTIEPTLPSGSYFTYFTENRCSIKINTKGLWLYHRPFNLLFYYNSTIVSTSRSTSFGSLATSTHERAG